MAIEQKQDSITYFLSDQKGIRKLTTRIGPPTGISVSFEITCLSTQSEPADSIIVPAIAEGFRAISL